MKVDATRKEIYEPREAFRQVFLEAERKRLEEIATAEAALAAAAQAKPDPKDKRKKSPGGGKKSPKAGAKKK
jgi:hypothetical protein